MNELYKAYSILGLEPGAPMEAINRRYKKLVVAWHPDRFHNVEGKREAEQELKGINNARDVLKDHFGKGGHKETGECACRAESSQKAAQSKQSSGGPGRASNTEGAKGDPEAARRREADSQRRSEEEATNKADQAAKAAYEQAMQNAFRREDKSKHDFLRWKISFGCAAIFILVLTVLIVSDGLAQPIRSGQNVLYGPKDGADQSDQLSEEWRSYQSDKAQVAFTLLRREPVAEETVQWRPPFVSNDRGAYWLSRLTYEQLVVMIQEQQKLSSQDLNNAKMTVDRYQKAIEFSQKRLAEAEVKLADPTISARDRQFAISDQAIQTKFLQENQESLRVAQQRLNELQGAGSGTGATQPTVTPAPACPTLTSAGDMSLEPLVQPDGSIKARDGGFLRFDSGQGVSSNDFERRR